MKYKFTRGVYRGTEEIELEIPENLKWIKVQPTTAHTIGHHDYITSIYYNEDEYQSENVWYNQRAINKYKFGNVILVLIHDVAENELPLEAIEEFNKKFQKGIEGYYGISYDKNYRIQWLYKIKSINKFGQCISDYVVCNSYWNIPRSEVLINLQAPIEDCSESSYDVLCMKKIKKSEKYKKMWYSLLYKYFKEMGLCDGNFLVGINMKYVNTSLNINEAAEIAMTLEDIQVEEKGDKTEITIPKGNEAKIKRIKDILDLV